eukprot:TRINITY_DN1499_c0_g1_i1.p1 TRINITY_DN1499_c0_g1~~TRINITY_DN1499_c0_g1_i1.p1  ORF type:complete len:600 (-),score=181.74 TRINITY_DN1499_c0_g1_i1:169-1968(-)
MELSPNSGESVIALSHNRSASTSEEDTDDLPALEDDDDEEEEEEDGEEEDGEEDDGGYNSASEEGMPTTTSQTINGTDTHNDSSTPHQQQGEGEGEGEDGGSIDKQKQLVPRRLVYTRPTAETITVECSDEGQIEIEKAVAIRMSVAIRKRLVENMEPNAIIQLENITGRALTKVMEYCHVHTAPHVISMDLKAWDDKFVKLDPGTLCELASAAYHLEIKPLVDLTCQAIAQLLKGKSPAEIRRTFNILYDFNPEDDAPPPTMRDKLRNKLCNPKRREKTPKQPLLAPPPTEADTRSVDELVSFINDGTAGSKGKGKTKAAKRARQRARKKQSKSVPGEVPSEVASTTTSGERTSLKRSRSGSGETQPLSPRPHLSPPIPLSSSLPSTTQTNTNHSTTQQQQQQQQQPSHQDTTAANTTATNTATATNTTTASNTTTANATSPPSTATASTTTQSTSASNTTKAHPDITPQVQHAQRQSHSHNNNSNSNNNNSSSVPLKNLSRSAPDVRPKKANSSTRVTDDSHATSRVPSEISLVSPDDDIWNETDDDDMDPEMKAQQDREVEEFRRRLEQINNTQANRGRVSLPSTLSLALIDSLKG